MAPPANDDLANATLVTATTSLPGQTTVDATCEPVECGDGFPSPSVWYRIESGTESTITLDFTNATWAWQAIVQVPTADPPADFNDWLGGTFVGNTNGGGGTADGSMTMNAPADYTVGDVLYVYVATFAEGLTTGNFDLDVTFGGGTTATAESDPSDIVTAFTPPSGDPPGSGLGSDCDIQVFLDNVGVMALEGSVTRRLNHPAQATIKVPMTYAFGGPGSRLQIWFDGTLYFHGFVMDCETDSGEDDGYTVYNASDPMELWQWRVVRADDGDFSKPDELLPTYMTGPETLNAILKNTEGSTTAQGNPALNPPADTEGPTFLTFGGVATDGCDLTGAPVDWPMTIAQFASLMVSTGCLDIVVTPTDPGGGIMGTVDLYNGDYGTDLSGSVILQYGMGNYTIRQIRWNEDMSGVINKLWYYLGPRVESEVDPAGDQHWRANITGTNPQFNPSGSAELVPPGGRSVDGTNTPVGPPWTNNPLGECIYNSRTNYGVRMQVQIFDARGDEATIGYWLYLRQWQAESWARQNPRALIHVTPIRGYPIGLFDIGDLVTVEAVSTVRGGFSGAQRIYGYTASWTVDGPCEISELQTSSDVGVDTGL